MSKIQEALKKLQTSRERSEPPRSRQQRDADSVATLVEPSRSKAPREHTGYEGPLIAVDRQALREAGLIAPEAHERVLADQYREMKRPLIANAFGKRVARVDDGKLIVVTSAVPGEGKTFTCINLAISIAQEQDHSVLLVDADVAKPHISNIFGIGESEGLLDLLEDDSVHAESFVLPTDVNGLSILPAGLPRRHATELLASSRMDQVVGQLGDWDEQRIIVFDSPPILRTTEAKVVAGIAGQVVLVVKAESTAQNAVTDAVRALGHDRAVNLVLNQAMVTGSNYQYGYGYGYGYGFATEAPLLLEDDLEKTDEIEIKKGIWQCVTTRTYGHCLQ